MIRILDIKTQKTRARHAAKLRRAELMAADDFDMLASSLGLMEHFPAIAARGAVIGGIWPLPGEIDPRPLMRALSDLGHSLALPCTPRKGKPLTFRAWTPGDKLKGGPYGTSEPYPERSILRPDFVLVPMLAFAPSGARLGYGGGFYDRTLAELRADGRDCFACGIAFAGQEMDTLPTDEYDIRLDAILTDKFYRTF
ncbi:MAG: 5-formyltetrahydrofolate cyclo-ligase [Maricaulaceae bacterium]